MQIICENRWLRIFPQSNANTIEAVRCGCCSFCFCYAYTQTHTYTHDNGAKEEVAAKDEKEIDVENEAEKYV